MHEESNGMFYAARGGQGQQKRAGEDIRSAPCSDPWERPTVHQQPPHLSRFVVDRSRGKPDTLASRNHE